MRNSVQPWSHVLPSAVAPVSPTLAAAVLFSSLHQFATRVRAPPPRRLGQRAMGDPWMLEGAMLASCYVVGMGVMAATALVHRPHAPAGALPFHKSAPTRRRRKNRRKKRGCGSSLDSGSTGGTWSSCAAAGTEGDAAAAATDDDDDNDDTLPLCPDDADCDQLNDPAHFQRFAHTCRLNPCYHAHVELHCFYFRHTEGQCIAQRALHEVECALSAPAVSSCVAPSPADSFSLTGASQTGSAGASPLSLTSRDSQDVRGGAACTGTAPPAPLSASGVAPSQQLISPNVPGALQLVVRSECAPSGAAVEPQASSRFSSFFVWGVWPAVRVHALKRYLHQVTGMPPADMELLAETASGAAAGGGAPHTIEMDDMEFVGRYTSAEATTVHRLATQIVVRRRQQ